MAQHLSIQV